LPYRILILSLLPFAWAVADPVAIARLGAWPEGSEVTVEGQVTGRAVVFSQHAHVAIRDLEGSAIVLEAPEFMFERVAPGDRLEVRGILASSGGMRVLRPVQLTTHGNAALPVPPLRRAEWLQQPSALGHTVRVEGRITAIGEDGAGQYLILDGRQAEPYPVYVPKRPGAGSLAAFHVGDRIEAVGIAVRDGKYRLEAADAGAITLLGRGWFVPPRQFLLVGLSFAVSVGWWWNRRRRARRRLRTIRMLNAISEELPAAATFSALARKIADSLPNAAPYTDVRLYRFDRAHHRLELITPGGEPGASLDPAARHEGVLEQAVAFCFRNRMPLRVTDARSSPLFWRFQQASARSLVVAPAQTREELAGVLSLSGDGKTRLSAEELTAVQHLANQAAIVCKQIEHRQRQEHLERSERMAAAGQLMEGVAQELNPALDSILALAHRLLELGTPEARPILTESLRASAVLARMCEAARQKEQPSEPVDLNHTVSGAVESCRTDWLEVAVRIDFESRGKPLWVMGSAAQLEQAFASLVSAAARASLESNEPAVTVECALAARRAVVTIAFRSPAGGALEALKRPGEETGTLAFSICRGIVKANGGDVRVEEPHGRAVIEVSLPLAFPGESTAAGSPSAGPSRQFTALVLEPDALVQRRLISAWAGQGHRAMPVANESEALDLLERLRVDVVFCAVHVGQMNWVEIFDRIGDRVPAFVLLSEGAGADEAALFPEGDGLLLRKPIDAGELGRLVDRIAVLAERGAPVRA
jgi:signal transduction histidine kinase